MPKELRMKPIEEDDDKFTLEEFKECVRDGFLIDYDGFGYLATENEMSNITVYPSGLWSMQIDPKFTHVVWFNR
jgi:hypothetical protein